MHQHGTTLANILLTAVVGTTPLWIVVFDGANYFATKMVPIVALAVACLQLYFLLRKFKR